MSENLNGFIQIPLIGGLGNQLFQYAGGLAITKNNSVEIQYFDNLVSGSRLLRVTPRKVAIESLIPNPVASLGRFEMLQMMSKRIVMKDYWLSDSIKKPINLKRISSTTRVVSGYFQSRYLVDQVFDSFVEALYKSEVLSQIVPKNQLNEITVHMRLGDKLSHKDLQYYGRTSVNYYLSGIEHLCSDDKFDSINIVSDQPEVARQLFEFKNLKYKFNYSRGLSEIDDLALISHSRGIVMSCSSFSWWGAKLASIHSTTRVVAPRTWLRESSGFDSYMNLPSWKLISKD